jgi:raffinose/stachyose/melibiose transport system permease protein
MGKMKNVPFRVFCYILIVFFLFLYLFPLFYVVNTSLKSAQDYLRNPTALTSTWQFDNFVTAWNKADFGLYIWNSILYTGVCTVFSLLISLFIAFPISRKYIPASGFFYFLFLCGLFLPNGMIPTFQLILKTGLYDTKIGYMLVMTGVSATAVFFYEGYFKSIPKELDEAATIDGCGYLRYVISIVFPLAKPAIVSMGMLSMIGVWNDIVSSTIYLTTKTNYNITRGMFVFQGQYSNDWTLTAAGILIVAAPLVTTYIFGQRYIVDGIMAGGVKA